MYLADVTNAFGTDLFTLPTTSNIKVRPYRRPRIKKSAVVRVLRNPTAPSTIIKNALLTW